MVQQTPGVYINEINAFPNSVVEVATAVPVFIGYTAKANYKGKSLANKPQRVTSLKEFETYFGKGAVPTFDLKERSATSRADREKLAVQPLLDSRAPAQGSARPVAPIEAAATGVAASAKGDRLVINGGDQ